MKILAKVLCAPALAIVFLLAFGGIAYVVMEQQKQAIGELAGARQSAVEAATGALQSVGAVQSGAYRLFTWRSAISEEQVKKTSGELLDQLDLLAGLLQGMRAQPQVSAAERAHIDAVLPRLSRYRGELQQAIEQSTDAATAASLMQGADATHAAIGRELQALVALEKQLTEASQEATLEAAQQAANLLLAITLVAVLVSLAAAVLASRRIVRPLRSAIASAGRIAEGDLTADVRVTGRDETADLLRALDHMSRQLRALVGDVATGAHAVADTSAQIAQGNLDLSQRTEEQASTLEETAGAMLQLSQTVEQNAQNAMQASGLATEASGVAEQGAAAVGRMVQTMDGIAAAARRIGEIIAVIDGIAFQTNILALNAAVEAARAGEQGRGFAVVASEVRALAQRSAAAARQVKDLVEDSVHRVDAGHTIAGDAGATMRRVVASVQRVNALIAEIASASREQSAGLRQVNSAVAQMGQVVQQNAALVEEASAATQSMKDEAGALLRLVERFRLHGATAAAFEPAATAADGPLPAIGYAPTTPGLLAS
ncbi:methyl-accepting chemotaxis protein [Ramlibacter pallidus]|uniref:HAMP domain-containing protein n=1 Tax=Ramlibacter pallidus TaxID=2780087 RepID=A0ABR9RZQ8_9BURK|nr:methyl-accepting chemotaxis protein [Ramlibacter pallidus]MBE7366746.1 HAMP domain-containing protein [Ramlibacter pallidus]